jgi:hypothetical protein
MLPLLPSYFNRIDLDGTELATVLPTHIPTNAEANSHLVTKIAADGAITVTDAVLKLLRLDVDPDGLHHAVIVLCGQDVRRR